MEDIKKIVDKLQSEASGLSKSVLGFIKEHKKAIIVFGALYFAYKYLFSEEGKDEDQK